ETLRVGEALCDCLDGRAHPRVVRGEESEERHHQHRRVELVSTERLDVRAGLLAPALGEDRVADVIALLGPPLHVRLARAERYREPYGAVERDPVHQLRIEEVAGAPAHLPDAFV